LLLFSGLHGRASHRGGANRQAEVGSRCRRQSVEHQRSSVFWEFNCSRLHLIQLATSLRHSETLSEKAWTSVGGVMREFRRVGKIACGRRKNLRNFDSDP